MKSIIVSSARSAAGASLAAPSSGHIAAQRSVPPAHTRPASTLNCASASIVCAIDCCGPTNRGCHGKRFPALRHNRGLTTAARSRPHVCTHAAPEPGTFSRSSSSASRSRRHRSPSSPPRDASTAAATAAAQATIRLSDEQGGREAVASRRTPSALASAVAASRQAAGPAAGTWEVGTRAVAADRKRRLRGPQRPGSPARPSAANRSNGNGNGRQQQPQQQRQQQQQQRQQPEQPGGFDDGTAAQGQVGEQGHGAAGLMPRGAAVGRHAFAVGAGRGLRGPEAWLAAAAAASSATATGRAGGNQGKGQAAAGASQQSPTAVRTAPAGNARPRPAPGSDTGSDAASKRGGTQGRSAVINFVHSLTTAGAMATAAAVRRASADFDTLEHWHAGGGGALAAVAAAARADAAAARGASGAAGPAAPAAGSAPPAVWPMMKAELRALVAAGSGRVSHQRRTAGAGAGGADADAEAEAEVEVAATRLLEAVSVAILDQGIYAVRNSTTRLRQVLWRLAAETWQEAAEGAEDVEGAQAALAALEQELVAAAAELEEAGGGEVGPEGEERLSRLAEAIGASRARAEAAWQAAEPSLTAAAAAAALRDATDVPDWLRSGLSRAVGQDASRLNGAQLAAVLAAAGAASLPFRPADADALVRRTLQLLAVGVRPQQQQQQKQQQQQQQQQQGPEHGAASHRGLPAADADGGSLSTDEAIAAAFAAAISNPAAAAPSNDSSSSTNAAASAAAAAEGPRPLPPALSALLMLLLVSVTPRELCRLQARWTLWAQFQRLTRGTAAAAGGLGGQLPLVAEAALLAAMDRMQLRAAGTPEEVAAMERVSRAVAAGAAAMRRTAQRPQQQQGGPAQQQQQQQQEEGEEARSASLNGRQVATLLSCLSAAGNLIGSECLVRLTSALTAASAAGTLPPASAAAAVGALALQYHGPSRSELAELMAPLVSELKWAHDTHNPDRPRPTGPEAAAERVRLQQLPVLVGRVEAALGGGLRLPWAAPDDVAALREELNRFVASGGLRPLAAAEAWEAFLEAAAARPGGAAAPSPADLDAFIDAARADLLADAAAASGESGSVLETLMAPTNELAGEGETGGSPPA